MANTKRKLKRDKNVIIKLGAGSCAEANCVIVLDKKGIISSVSCRVQLNVHFSVDPHNKDAAAHAE